MKKRLVSSSFLLLILLSLTGCNVIGEKTASLTIIYGAAAVLSLILMIGYCCSVRRKNAWFILMFSAILVVNIGYFCLAISSSLGEALLANRIAYLGSVLLPMTMLMIILNVTNTPYKKPLPWCLLGLAAVILFIAASPGYLDIYYKEVSFETVGGVGTLTKVYGPLHPLYLVYLLGYFASMITVIVRAQVKKTIDTLSHAIVIAIAVLVNIGVWLIEQLVSIEFEMLSVSYIISELFLLGAHLMIHENQRLNDQIKQHETASSTKDSTAKTTVADDINDDLTALFTGGLEMLTPREREIFDAYVAGKSTKDILADFGIKENTLKYHSRNLYNKLGVSSRKQLLAVYNRLNVANTTK